MRAAGATPSQIDALFDSLDRTGDGAITFRELNTAMRNDLRQVNSRALAQRQHQLSISIGSAPHAHCMRRPAPDMCTRRPAPDVCTQCS